MMIKEDVQLRQLDDDNCDNGNFMEEFFLFFFFEHFFYELIIMFIKFWAILSIVGEKFEGGQFVEESNSYSIRH